MPTTEILDFINAAIDLGVDTTAFGEYKSFLAAADATHDGNVSKQEFADWLAANASFTTQQLEALQGVVSSPRYVETKYGMGASFEEQAQERERDHAAGSAADAAMEHGRCITRSEILEFIQACVDAGVDVSKFESQREFLAQADADSDGKVDRDELRAWLHANESFSEAQLATIKEVIEAGRLADDRAAYGEGKYGMYSIFRIQTGDATCEIREGCGRLAKQTAVRFFLAPLQLIHPNRSSPLVAPCCGRDAGAAAFPAA